MKKRVKRAGTSGRGGGEIPPQANTSTGDRDEVIVQYTLSRNDHQEEIHEEAGHRGGPCRGRNRCDHTIHPRPDDTQARRGAIGGIVVWVRNGAFA
jgi:hypothetical protein